MYGHQEKAKEQLIRIHHPPLPLKIKKADPKTHIIAFCKKKFLHYLLPDAMFYYVCGIIEQPLKTAKADFVINYALVLCLVFSSLYSRTLVGQIWACAAFIYIHFLLNTKRFVI